MSRYGLTAGTQCYKYTLESLISNPNSSQNDVWLARDRATDTQVALKVIPGADHDVVNRLYEAQVGARLRHVSLCEVVGADVCEINGATVDGSPAPGPFVLIGFKYQPGGACTRDLVGPGVMTINLVHRLLLDVLAGLEYLHGQGLHHNDIKPANILKGQAGTYLLTDYGIARPSGDSEAAPFYMPHAPPESLREEAGRYLNNHFPCTATDIYQLGLTAYRLLNGADGITGAYQRHQSQGTLSEFFRKVQRGEIPDRNAYMPSVPHRLRLIVNKALSVNPSERFVTALEFQREMEKLHFPLFWEYDATNQLVLKKNGAVYRVEKNQKGNRYEVSVVVRYPSGHTRRPTKYCKGDLRLAQADAHIRNTMQILMKP